MSETLAGALLARGDVLAAADAATAVLTRDPLRERATAIAMEAALAVGDHVGAARLYRRFEKLLDAELAIKPSAALRTIAATLDD